MQESSISSNRLNLRETASPLQHNIISELHKSGPLTRKELVGKLNKARTTIYDNLLKLQKINVVTKFARNNGERGRPTIYWKLATK